MKCVDFDFLEIACMYRLEVSLTLTSGEVYTGVAKDIVKNRHLQLLAKGTEVLVSLDHLQKMDAITTNPHFSTVTFSTSA
ncbi:Rho-binding antiterminator [Thaumasiovibrio subtropicus]|uniref:Rho-binding antiterminator n=1 Tax=Thaumasiovibrio subtropicus TaxID=1891207 RepID=UPI000B357F71|nr:Rho-binding antiterminator [Thaumasiovibrio subtropicus]